MNCPRCNCKPQAESNLSCGYLALFECGTMVQGDKVYQSGPCEKKAAEYRQKLLDAAVRSLERKMRRL